MPSKDLITTRETVLHLLKFPYVFTDTGRQCLFDLEKWMIYYDVVELVTVILLLFMKRKENFLTLLREKVADYFIVTGLMDYVKEFREISGRD